MAVLHAAGQRHANDVVAMTLADFVAWFGVLELPDLDPAEVQVRLESGYTIAELAGMRAEEGNDGGV